MARLKIIEQFDGHFTLDPEAKATLVSLLTHDSFCQQVAQQIGGDRLEFTGLLFQPVPYTTQAPKGMPPDYEQYYNSPEHVIINVPPPFMFQAKIFNPSRLCAIYRKVGSSV